VVSTTHPYGFLGFLDWLIIIIIVMFFKHFVTVRSELNCRGRRALLKLY
jgi:hypothetical protein